jgi:hypothetical protein
VVDILISDISIVTFAGAIFTSEASIETFVGAIVTSDETIVMPAGTIEIFDVILIGSEIGVLKPCGIVESPYSIYISLIYPAPIFFG